MQRQSPPKHRHDGTSPLPLGMDWSPPPRLWAGRETIWPHDPRTGWSYCVVIPSWVVLAKSKDSDPTVFYRVQVGIQSPEGSTTTRTVLRRFNNFLKLHAALKRAFPRKNIPPAPPKGLLTMRTKAMLEGRRISLEEWMSKLLSDLDLSRSIAVASFLELEAAARSSFQDEGQGSPKSHNSINTIFSSFQTHPNSSTSALAGSSSLTSEYGSDTAYETSEIGTPSLGRDNNSEAGTEDLLLDEDLTSPIDKFVKYGMSNIDEGLSLGQAILEHLEGFPKHKLHAREIHNLALNNSNGSSSKAPQHTEDTMKLLLDQDNGTVAHHVRKISNESFESDMFSQRNSELSNLASSETNGYGNVDFRSGPQILKKAETSGASDFQLPDDVQLIIPLDQRQKLNRVLTTMQRRLVTTKTDMEDLISRLNQEISVKDYLATKVKDLEAELEATKQKGKENLEQALLIERERVTQMQWDMEELRRTSIEMELKLKSSGRLDTESIKAPSNQQKHLLQQELDSAKLQYEDLLKRNQQLEVKSKSDIKVLVKEVKSLRSSQAGLKQQLDQLLTEKLKAEELLREERESYEQVRIYWRKLLYKCQILYSQLQECKIHYLTDEKGDDVHIDISSMVNPSDIIATSDNQIGLLITEVKQLAGDSDYLASASDASMDLDNDLISVDEELKKMLVNILVDNGVLRKEVNSLILYTLRMNKLLENPSDKIVHSET
ncbi:PX domain-containing protein EREL1-like [Primulina tabacum]|uniref:PX domain-containing protein EREL1-like n=1 Tax=Primulina tabacum TaxID=48773 RepID=UPI003F5AB973